MVRVFDVENGAVKLNENCFLIPELKAIVDKYKDPKPALAFVYYMTAYDSPYANLPDTDKEAEISEDVGGEFSLEDDIILAAVDKMNKLFETPLSRLYAGAKKNVDNIGQYLSTTVIEGGLKGNLGDLYRIQTGLIKIAENFKKVEQMKDEEIKTSLRGKAQMGMY